MIQMSKRHYERFGKAPKVLLMAGVKMLTQMGRGGVRGWLNPKGAPFLGPQADPTIEGVSKSRHCPKPISAIP